MRIEEDVKLDFKDVLIRPKRSTLGSRKDVDISREFVMRNSGRTFSGVWNCRLKYIPNVSPAVLFGEAIYFRQKVPTVC